MGIAGYELCGQGVFIKQKRQREEEWETVYKHEIGPSNGVFIWNLYMECVYNKHMFAERRVF